MQFNSWNFHNSDFRKKLHWTHPWISCNSTISRDFPYRNVQHEPINMWKRRSHFAWPCRIDSSCSVCWRQMSVSIRRLFRWRNKIVHVHPTRFTNKPEAPKQNNWMKIVMWPFTQQQAIHVKYDMGNVFERRHFHWVVFFLVGMKSAPTDRCERYKWWTWTEFVSPYPMLCKPNSRGRGNET